MAEWTWLQEKLREAKKTYKCADCGKEFKKEDVPPEMFWLLFRPMCLACYPKADC